MHGRIGALSGSEAWSRVGSELIPGLAGRYPLQTFVATSSASARCTACRLFAAAYVTVHDRPPSPSRIEGVREKRGKSGKNSGGCIGSESTGGGALFCEACHGAFHYGSEGELLSEYRDNENFRVFPVLPLGF
jgi:hypothetical protein